MLSGFVKKRLLEDDLKISKIKKRFFNLPKYNPDSYCKDIATNDYFYALLLLRHYIKFTSDNYFGIEIGAKNIDLFMITPSISSPMGPGSDSKPIKIKFGQIETFLVDSSQFGFEPLLLNKLDKVYCYLPSMRGENPDNRHLNQFFHCEFEMTGKLEDLIPIAEKYVKSLCATILLMKNTVSKISADADKTKKIVKKIVKLNAFPIITFDEAIKILIKSQNKRYINFTKYGKDITQKGEIKLMDLLHLDVSCLD